MKKKVFLLLFGIVIIVCISLLLYNWNKSTIIKVTLNDNTDSVEIKVGDLLTYSLLGDEYQFKITSITKNKISIEVNKYGLTNTNNLMLEDNKFIIEEGKKLELHTQSMDYQEWIIFEY